MWIKTLKASNFKGQNFEDLYGENEVRISGRNKSGKTSRMRAFFWLLTGYSDWDTPANSNLFDDRFEVTKDTPVAFVEATIVMDDGEEYELRREAEAKFVRKRGTDTYEKAASDNYKYFVDEIERSATDFRDWLNEHITSEDMLKFVLDGHFFIDVIFSDKKKARQIIERLVGTVTPEEMKGDYSDIMPLLAKYSLDEVEERAKNLAKGIDQRLNEIPTLIQNIEREISEIEQIDFNAVEQDIITAEKERETLDQRLLDLTERMKPQMEAKYKAEADRRMRAEVYEKALTEFVTSNDAEISRLKSEIAAVKRQNEESKRQYNTAVCLKERYTAERDKAIADLKVAEQKRERLLAERDAEKSKVLDPNATKCPHCGAELTGDKLQAVIDNFERVRRERIDTIVNNGKANNAEIARLTKIAEDAQPYIDAALPEVITQSTDELEARVIALASHIPTKEDFNATDKGKTLLADIAAVVIPEVVMVDDSEIKARKKEVNDYLIPLYEKRGLKSRAENLRKQVDTLRTEQREKGSELAKHEHQRQLVKDYKQEQMQILSHKVNDGLTCSRIDVWSTQKDGTIVPDVVLKDAAGVSYSTTNNASRIRTAIDIQRFFCEKLGVNMPAWVDECSILDSTNMPDIDGTQTFYLSCAETALTIESK